ncbi:MAG: hypothetical protein AABP62_19205 [Planctomycetota bacterium]
MELDAVIGARPRGTRSPLRDLPLFQPPQHFGIAHKQPANERRIRSGALGNHTADERCNRLVGCVVRARHKQRLAPIKPCACQGLRVASVSVDHLDFMFSHEFGDCGTFLFLDGHDKLPLLPCVSREPHSQITEATNHDTSALPGETQNFLAKKLQVSDHTQGEQRAGSQPASNLQLPGDWLVEMCAVKLQELRRMVKNTPRIG